MPTAMDTTRLTERLRRLPREDVLAMYYAAADATECAAALAHSGSNPVTAVLNGAEVAGEGMHVPPEGVIDEGTHSQYYYRCGAAEKRGHGEHGYFHIFVRPKLVAPKLVPIPVPFGCNPADEASWTAHLVGIATGPTGQVIRLFTTNRWVTGEVWYDAAAVISLLDSFAITIDKPSHDLSRWITAVVRMFRPQIADLIRARDAKIEEYKAVHPVRNVFEDRTLAVISDIPADFFNQIRAIEAALDLQRAA